MKLLTGYAATMSLASRPLHEGWTFTQAGGGVRGAVGEGEWIPVQAFPTTVHVELLKAGRIPDPVSGAARFDRSRRTADMPVGSSLGCRNGTCNVSRVCRMWKRLSMV